jgi:hypothetical protein
MLMTSITHWDGADVVVFDARGRFMAAIDEVRVEPDRAVIALQARRVPPDLTRMDTASCAIHSARDGRLHWQGPVRCVLV